MEYGKTIKPRALPQNTQGNRRNQTKSNCPSTIDQNQDLLVRFPKLGNDDVSIPGMANLSFNIELTSTADLNRSK